MLAASPTRKEWRVLKTTRATTAKSVLDLVPSIPRVPHNYCLGSVP